MDFQNLSLNPDDHKYVHLTDIPSVMSFSYLSKFDFQSLKPKTLRPTSSKPDNHIMQNVELKFMPGGYNAGHSEKLCDFTKDFHGTQSGSNIRKFDSCPQLSTMNILSYLVGGFVGSKSQVGVTSMQGYRFQIWDLVWQKLLDIMDDEHIDEKTIQVEQQDFEKPVKQSYAEVAKTKVTNSASDSDRQVKRLKESMKSNKKKHSFSTYYTYKGKSDFDRCDKKFSLHEMDCFSSSRWSNSRRKHSKKGLEKINRRFEREAAKDGLEFVNEELDKDVMNRTCRNVSFKRTTYNNDKFKHKEQTIKPTVSVLRFHNIEEKIKNGQECQLECIGKTNLKHSDSGLLSATFKRRPSVSSVCSVDSDDSFIVFDRTLDDYSNIDVFTEICYNSFDLLQTEDDSSSSDSECSTSDETRDDAQYVVSNNCKLNFCQNEHANDSSCNQQLNCTKEQPYNIVSNTTGKLPDAELVFTNVPCLNDSIAQNFMKYSFDDTNSQLLKSRSSSECSVESDDSFITFDSYEDPISPTLKSGTDCDIDIFGIKSCVIDFNSDDDFKKPSSSAEGCSLQPSSPTGPPPPYVEPADQQQAEVDAWLKDVNKYYTVSLKRAPKRKLKSPAKKIRFAEGEKLVSVKTIVSWNFAHREARIGVWEELARDRMRFADRINRVGPKIQKVLEPAHREKIWKERFADN